MKTKVKDENKKAAILIEGNRLMALFMEAEVFCRTEEDKRISGFFNCEYQKFELDIKTAPFAQWKIPGITGNCGAQSLRFNTEWNYLMPVVEKVNAIVLDTTGVRVTMRNNATLIERVGKEDWEAGPIVTGKGMMLNTFFAIVEFLEWYTNEH